MNKERDVIGEVIAEDNARPIPPAVAEYLASEFQGPAKHTATSDGERVAELELLNAELWRQNEALTQRLAGGGETLEVVATIECLDESTTYIESRSKRINVDNAVYNDALVFESDAKAIIAQRDARIEEQAREIERLNRTIEAGIENELAHVGERNAMQRQRDQAIKQLARECDDTDSFIRIVGLDPDQLRTDGGFLNLTKARAELSEIKGAPVVAGAEAVERDWAEDFEHENGEYTCLCRECHNEFIGYKRRTICKACANAAPPASGAVPVPRELLERLVENLRGTSIDRPFPTGTYKLLTELRALLAKGVA